MIGTVVDRPSSPPIDSRIRARRIDVRRREGRRRLRRLLAVIAVSGLVLGGWGLLRSPLFDVDEIAVSGTAETPLDEVLASLDVERGDALIDVDVSAAATRVADLPWVAGVDVERSWGGTVTVVVTERTPDLVAVGASGELWLVDRDGSVLGPTRGEADGLVRVEGLAVPPPGAAIDPAGAPALELAAALPEHLLALVAAVEVDDDGAISIRLHARSGEVDVDGIARNDGGRVLLGDGRELDEQIRATTAVLDQVDLTDLVSVDVRVPANPVVTRTPVPADTAPEDRGTA